MNIRGGDFSTFILTFCLFASSAVNFANCQNSSMDEIEAVHDRKLSRQKRYLIFPEGSNVQLVYCLTIGAYWKPGELVMGLTAALAWELPNKVDEKLSNLLHRQSRSVFFPKIEAFLDSLGLEGRNCVMRALCETGQRDSNEIGTGTFLQELLYTIFRLRNDGSKFDLPSHQEYDEAHDRKENCQFLYPTCPYSIYDLDF